MAVALRLRTGVIVLFLLLHSASRPYPVVQWSISHAFHNRLAQLLYLFVIIRAKGSCNGRPVIHPALQLELAHHLCTVGFDTTLCDLITTNIGLVQVVNKVHRQLDQKVALSLGMIGIVQPILKIFLRTEPQHSMRPVLYPERLFPLLHNNSTETNS